MWSGSTKTGSGLISTESQTLFEEPYSCETRFDGEDACRGSIGSGYCSRIVHWVGVATFNP